MVGSGPGGSADRSEQELILKANTAYIFLLTNATASANVHHLFIDWYENTNL